MARRSPRSDDERYRLHRLRGGGRRTAPGPGDRLAGFASDLDRTLIRPNGGVTPTGRSALRAACALGLKTLLVSGRELRELRPFVRSLRFLDGVVAENGAIVEAPLGSTTAVRGRAVARAVRRRLASVPDLEIRAGEVVVSVPVGARRSVTGALRGLPVRLIANVDRLMVLPRGVDKGSGTRLALRRLGLGRSGYAAIGDAENDLALLRGARLSAAVRNAEPAVRAEADFRCRRRYDAGVLEFVRGPLSERAAARPTQPGP